MNYIDEIADEIIQEVYPNHKVHPNDYPLYRIYALLVLTTGPHTTNRNVHDAWSVYTATHGHHDHRSLIPYEQLSPAVQELDRPYAEAIRTVARRRIDRMVAEQNTQVVGDE